MLDEIDNIKKLNVSNLTYKSPNLIFSSYELSVTQQRIIQLGCKKLQPIYIEKRLSPNDLTKILGAMQFSLIDISVSEYKKEFEINTNNLYDTLEKEIDDLYENKGIRYFDKEDNNKPKKRRWVSSADFDRKNGKISITFNPDLILDLLVFKNSFIALAFDIKKNVKSKYAFRIYEILKSVAYMGEYKMLIEDFKFLLDITNKYDNFGALNRDVIKPNLKTIDKLSDITVTCKSIRQGKSSKWLLFNIKRKSNYNYLGDIKFKEKIPTAFNEIQCELSKYKIELTSQTAEIMFDIAIEVTKNKYKDMNALDYIKSKIDLLDNYLENNNVESSMGFLIKALKDDYKNNKIDKTNKHKFNNFSSDRNYTKEQMKYIENKLLGW